MERVNLPSVNGSAEDEGLTGNMSLLSIVEDFFAAFSHLSNLVVYDQPQDVLGSVPDIDGEVVTLTLLPRSRWQTLLNLDVIQVSIARLASCFAYSADLNFSAETSQKSLQKPRRRHPFSYPHFQELIRGSWFRKKDRKRRRRVDRRNQPQLPKVSFQKNCRRNQRREIVGVTSTYDDRRLTSLTDDAFFTFAKSLSPAAVDLEIRSLVTVQDLSIFLNALTQRLKSRRDFEAVQTYLNLFLRVHGEMLIQSTELRSDMEALLLLQRQESSRLLDSISSCLGTLAFVRDTI
jgi:U3 small nucleolar RNA-associated protein 21